ncbi:mechanosensitive ion channel family protein [Cupriavidus sp. AU9028]|uniref:mechanosensitive ion channel family protein n=1 Tax=Cupriavidus sp. AU9028 TaxID=2871157 RepID=UPI001C952F49|nr:mechanosensitive ion channel family protein [Cupriavidus sp. AU9028]MBY4897175.1 mechanosensitive ion channel family protein [Cupriavidus sp. AU9028]
MKEWHNFNLFLGISALDWLYAVIAGVVSYLVLVTLLRFASARLDRLAANTKPVIIDRLAAMLRNTSQTVLLIAAVLIAVDFLGLPPKWANRIEHVWFLLIGFQIAIWINHAVTLWTQDRLTGDGITAHNPVFTTVMAWAMRVMLWSVLLLAVLANMGVNITAFVASLGVGGVAVALAVQNILSDLFASLAIGLDKPFENGDFIVFGDIAGSVERIGLKTTRLRALSGEQIVCSNTELLKTTIHNYKRMAERRIQFNFRVTYQTPPQMLRRIPDIVRAAVEEAGNTRFDRAHFKGFGESALEFEVVYYVTSADYNQYMDVQQFINLSLLTGLQEMGVEFGVPVRTVQLVRDGTDEDEAGNTANERSEPRRVLVETAARGEPELSAGR